MWKIILTLGAFGDYNILRRYTKKIPLLKPLYALYVIWHGAFLPLRNTIEGDIFFPHEPRGVFLSAHCKIGEGCTILQHVTIGSNYLPDNQKNGLGGHRELEIMCLSAPVPR